MLLIAFFVECIKSVALRISMGKDKRQPVISRF